MVMIPDVAALEDLWTDKLLTVAGVRSAFSIGQIEDLGNERVFKAPAAIVMHTGSPAQPPRVIGGPVEQEGTMTWSIFVVAETMRATRRGAGSQTVGRSIMEAVIGWEIVEGWDVYLVDFRPMDSEDARSMYELQVAHPFDLIGN